MKKRESFSSEKKLKTESDLLTDKQKADSWVFQKQSRLNALYQASFYIWKTQGSGALIRHFYNFLKGKRRNTTISVSSLPEKIKTEAELYKQWVEKNSLNKEAVKEQAIYEKTLSYRPLISVLTPVYNIDEKILEKTIKSVIAQTYSNWELCLVDGASTKPQVRSVLEKYSQLDKRIKVKYLDENLGIVGNSNQAIAMAEGEFVALLDHDDELTIDALYENVLLLNKHPAADMIYSDEDKLDLEEVRCDPHFKPDWSPDLFCSMMYTCHLGVYRKSLVEKAGGFRAGFDGAQDYDLVLRLIEQTNEIYHIPKVLYHWRKIVGSTSLSLDNKDYAKVAQIKAVTEHFQRLNINAEIMAGLADNLLRVKRFLSENPKVSIIIPTRDQVKLLKTCVNSILQKTDYKNYEIIIVDNGSVETATLKFFEEIEEKGDAVVLKYNYPFNFAAINNFAVKHATGEIILFLNNDTEVISGEWLESMVEHAVRPEVVGVGALALL